ncbi:MAG: class I SAM-dependent methyltransferase [Leptospirales bacterium]
MKKEREFDWESTYSENPVEELGWYYPNLDPDLDFALSRLGIHSGAFLDLGTGPGTQALELSKKGFSVTGADISEYAIKKASGLSDKVEFIRDDILNSGIKKKFDYIFDRGCYHVMSKKRRREYVKAVTGLLKDGGLLFLKCFSDKEPDIGKGPFLSSAKTIHKVFDKYFSVNMIKDTFYQGTRETLPKALFVIMKKTT